MRGGRDTVTTSSTPVGSLAAALFGAESALLAAEHALEAMLDSLYGASGWHGFEAGRGVLDVYLVIPSPAACDALHRAGFALVTEHNHQARAFRECACRQRSAP